MSVTVSTTVSAVASICVSTTARPTNVFYCFNASVGVFSVSLVGGLHQASTPGNS